MRLRDAASESWTLYRKHFGELMQMELIEVVLRLIVLTPLLFLCATETRAAALLCVPLFFLIVPPARQNAAQALLDMEDGGSCLSLELINAKHYGRKVLRGLRTGGLLLLWALPWLLASLFLGIIYSGKVDAFTVLRGVTALGGGSFTAGVKLAAALYVLAVLPFFFGCAFHSWSRFGAALGQSRMMIRSRRGGLILCWLAGLLTLVPFLAVTVYVGMDYVSGVMSALGNLASGSIALPPLDRNIYLIGGAFVALLLPLLPLRSLLTASYVRGLPAEAEAPVGNEKAVL